VEQLFATHSHRQIANAAGVSERTVRRICRSLNLKREREEDAVIRSENMKKIYQSENRRILFGLEQNTDRLLWQGQRTSKDM
jgi:Helix-turn-helix domain, rpiR family.